MDGNFLCSGKGERQQHAGSTIGDDESGNSAERGQEDTFCEQLTDDPRTHCAEGGANGHFCAAVHAANEKKVGDVGAGNEEHQAGDPH